MMGPGHVSFNEVTLSTCDKGDNIFSEARFPCERNRDNAPQQFFSRNIEKLFPSYFHSFARRQRRRILRQNTRRIISRRSKTYRTGTDFSDQPRGHFFWIRRIDLIPVQRDSGHARLGACLGDVSKGDQGPSPDDVHISIFKDNLCHKECSSTRGYIEAIREIEQQLHTFSDMRGFDDIVVACGSGATIAGLSLGSWLSNLEAKVHAFSVCDDPDYFYDYVQGLLDGLKAGVIAPDIMNIQNAKGLGYAINTEEEIKFVKEVACTTGVVLDPVYSGKAAFGLMKYMAEHPEKWKGRRILFVHTGGLLGIYDKTNQLAPLVGSWRKMELSDSVPREDGIGKMF